MSSSNTPAMAASNTALKTKDQIESWLVGRAAELLKIPSEKIDTCLPFASYGLDSVAAIGLMVDLEEWLARDLPETLAWDYPTIDALAEHLSAQP